MVVAPDYSQTLQRISLVKSRFRRVGEQYNPYEVEALASKSYNKEVESYNKGLVEEAANKYQSLDLQSKYSKGDPNISYIDSDRRRYLVEKTGQRFGGQDVYYVEGQGYFVGYPSLVYTESRGGKDAKLIGKKIEGDKIYSYERYQTNEGYDRYRQVSTGEKFVPEGERNKPSQAQIEQYVPKGSFLEGFKYSYQQKAFESPRVGTDGKTLPSTQPKAPPSIVRAGGMSITNSFLGTVTKGGVVTSTFEPTKITAARAEQLYRYNTGSSLISYKGKNVHVSDVLQKEPGLLSTNFDLLGVAIANKEFVSKGALSSYKKDMGVSSKELGKLTKARPYLNNADLANIISGRYKGESLSAAATRLGYKSEKAPRQKVITTTTSSMQLGAGSMPDIKTISGEKSSSKQSLKKVEGYKRSVSPLGKVINDIGLVKTAVLPFDLLTGTLPGITAFGGNILSGEGLSKSYGASINAMNEASNPSFLYVESGFNKDVFEEAKNRPNYKAEVSKRLQEKEIGKIEQEYKSNVDKDYSKTTKDIEKLSSTTNMQLSNLKRIYEKELIGKNEEDQQKLITKYNEEQEKVISYNDNQQKKIIEKFESKYGKYDESGKLLQEGTFQKEYTNKIGTIGNFGEYEKFKTLYFSSPFVKKDRELKLPFVDINIGVFKPSTGLKEQGVTVPISPFSLSSPGVYKPFITGIGLTTGVKSKKYGEELRAYTKSKGVTEAAYKYGGYADITGSIGKFYLGTEAVSIFAKPILAGASEFKYLKGLKKIPVTRATVVGTAIGIETVRNPSVIPETINTLLYRPQELAFSAALYGAMVPGVDILKTSTYKSEFVPKKPIKSTFTKKGNVEVVGTSELATKKTAYVGNDIIIEQVQPGVRTTYNRFLGTDFNINKESVLKYGKFITDLDKKSGQFFYEEVIKSGKGKETKFVQEKPYPLENVRLEMRGDKTLFGAYLNEGKTQGKLFLSESRPSGVSNEYLTSEMILNIRKGKVKGVNYYSGFEKIASEKVVKSKKGIYSKTALPFSDFKQTESFVNSYKSKVPTNGGKWVYSEFGESVGYGTKGRLPFDYDIFEILVGSKKPKLINKPSIEIYDFKKVNKNWGGSYNAIKNKIRISNEYFFEPKGSPGFFIIKRSKLPELKKVFTHEFGHAVDEQLTRNYNINIMRKLEGKKYFKTEYKRLVKRNIVRNLDTEIENYKAYNQYYDIDKEVKAEIFGQYSVNPIEFGKYAPKLASKLDELFGKRKFVRVGKGKSITEPLSTKPQGDFYKSYYKATGKKVSVDELLLKKELEPNIMVELGKFNPDLELQLGGTVVGLGKKLPKVMASKTMKISETLPKQGTVKYDHITLNEGTPYEVKVSSKQLMGQTKVKQAFPTGTKRVKPIREINIAESMRETSSKQIKATGKYNLVGDVKEPKMKEGVYKTYFGDVKISKPFKPFSKYEKSKASFTGNQRDNLGTFTKSTRGKTRYRSKSKTKFKSNYGYGGQKVKVEPVVSFGNLLNEINPVASNFKFGKPVIFGGLASVYATKNSILEPVLKGKNRFKQYTPSANLIKPRLNIEVIPKQDQIYILKPRVPTIGTHKFIEGTEPTKPKSEKPINPLIPILPFRYYGNDYKAPSANVGFPLSRLGGGGSGEGWNPLGKGLKVYGTVDLLGKRNKVLDFRGLL